MRLLLESARLLLRDGAAPFRSLGHLSVRPRPYQFVPLVMALRQPTVRLLIADDVGVDKTIEAALIARELLDRGAAHRPAVLCPPYLCEQWQAELQGEMDGAVTVAYGWSDLSTGSGRGVDLGHGFHETAQGAQFTISVATRPEAPGRLELNHQRCAERRSQQDCRTRKKRCGGALCSTATGYVSSAVLSASKGSLIEGANIKPPEPSGAW